MRAPFVLFAIGALLGGRVPPAHADDTTPASVLAAANQARDELDFEKVLALTGEIESSGKAQPGDLVALYRLRGEALAALGRAAEAELAFRLLLALDPSVSLPAGSSPKLSQPFEAARAFVDPRGRIAAHCAWSVDGNHLLVVVDSDPTDAIAGAWVAQVHAGQRQLSELQGHGRFDFELARVAAASATCGVSDAHGNHLTAPMVIGFASAPAIIKPATRPHAQAVTARPSRWTRWYWWAAAAAVGGGVGYYFGNQAKDDQASLDAIVKDSSKHYYADAAGLADRGSRHALYANIALGCSAAFAIGSILFLVRDLRRSEPADDRGGTLALLPAEDGAELAWAASF